MHPENLYISTQDIVKTCFASPVRPIGTVSDDMLAVFPYTTLGYKPHHKSEARIFQETTITTIPIVVLTLPRNASILALQDQNGQSLLSVCLNSFDLTIPPFHAPLEESEKGKRQGKATLTKSPSPTPPATSPSSYSQQTLRSPGSYSAY